MGSRRAILCRRSNENWNRYQSMPNSRNLRFSDWHQHYGAAGAVYSFFSLGKTIAKGVTESAGVESILSWTEGLINEKPSRLISYYFFLAMLLLAQKGSFFAFQKNRDSQKQLSSLRHFSHLAQVNKYCSFQSTSIEASSSTVWYTCFSVESLSALVAPRSAAEHKEFLTRVLDFPTCFWCLGVSLILYNL